VCDEEDEACSKPNCGARIKRCGPLTFGLEKALFSRPMRGIVRDSQHGTPYCSATLGKGRSAAINVPALVSYVVTELMIACFA
jgi:hypothetical protein